MCHTPGPWNTGGVVTRVEVLPEGWRVPLCVADCHTMNAPYDEAERCANARLIAAAPDLLAALERCAYVIGHNSCSDGKTPNGFALALDHARAALKRVKGGA